MTPCKPVTMRFRAKPKPNKRASKTMGTAGVENRDRAFYSYHSWKIVFRKPVVCPEFLPPSPNPPPPQEERFVPCYATVTSNMSTESFQEMKYKAPDRRVFSAVAPPSSVARPNYHDALRRGELVVRKRERDDCRVAPV